MSYHKASEVHRGPGAVAAVDAVSPIRRRVRQARARRSAQLDRRLAAIVRHPQSMGLAITGGGVVGKTGNLLIPDGPRTGPGFQTQPRAPLTTVRSPYVPPPPPPTPVTTVVSGMFGRPTRAVSSGTGTTFGTGTHQPGNVGPLPNPTLSPGGRTGIHPSSFPPTVHPTFPSGGGTSTPSGGSAGASSSDAGSGAGGGGSAPYDPSADPGVDTSSLTPPEVLPDVDLPVVGKINSKWLLIGGAIAAFAFWNHD